VETYRFEVVARASISWGCIAGGICAESSNNRQSELAQATMPYAVVFSCNTVCRCGLREDVAMNLLCSSESLWANTGARWCDSI
jgi:hypothetical protein